MPTLKTIGLLIPFMLALDYLWIGVLMKGFYLRELGEITRRNGDTLTPRWGAAILVYLLIPAGLLLFVRPLIVSQPSVVNAFLRGALFGAVLYGVYDLTNLAILEKWSLRVTIVDIIWGTVLCGLSAVAMQTFDRWWTP